MKLFVFDLSLLVLFTIGVAIFLWRNKKNVDREGILYIYRTQIGVKILNYIGTKYKKTLDFFAYIIVAIGYLLMIFFTWYMIKTVYYYLVYPQIIEVFDGPPLMLLIPYFPQIFGATEFFPNFYFLYFIISIAIVAIVHEGAHGIYMRRYGIGVKSTGFGFLGPILAFFVEQEEKDMEKKPIFQQLSVLASGVFANLLTALIFFGMLFLFFTSFYSPYGVMIAGYSTSIIATTDIDKIISTGETIQVEDSKLIQLQIEDKTYFAPENFFELNLEELKSIDGQFYLYQDQPAIRQEIKGTLIQIDGKEIESVENVANELSGYNVGENIEIKTDYNGEINSYNIELGESYEEAGRSVIGISIGPKNNLNVFQLIDNLIKDSRIDYRTESGQEFYDFMFLLLEWIILINFLVALFNMLPLGIFDGGRFFYLTVLAITKNKKIAENSFKFTTIALLVMVATLMVIWVLRRFIFPLF